MLLAKPSVGHDMFPVLLDFMWTEKPGVLEPTGPKQSDTT